jgi:hypothetical protein
MALQPNVGPWPLSTSAPTLFYFVTTGAWSTKYGLKEQWRVFITNDVKNIMIVIWQYATA